MRREKWREWPFVFLLVVFCFSSFVLGLKPLSDPDLGWHLAGGMWILDHGKVPQRDPLAAPGNFWLCYSWLPEVVFALVYHVTGFAGLRLLQGLLLAFQVGVFLFYLRACVPGVVFTRGTALTLLVVLLFLLPLIAPVWKLRPQVMSLTLFSLVLLLMKRNQMTFVRLLAITVLWVNIHIYWVFLPAMVFINKVVFGNQRLHWFVQVVLLVAAGMLNPYGWRHFEGLWQYAFHHKMAYSLINEFQPTSPRLGLVFGVYVLLVLFLFFSVRSIIRKASLSELSIFTLFFVASILQAKYLPLFAIVSAALLVPVILVRFSSQRFKEDQELVWEKGLQGPSWLLLGVSGLFILACMVVVDWRSNVDPKYTTLRQVVDWLRENPPSPDKSQIVVLNTFGDGGWLAFYFYLSKGTEESESRFKISIDGRTLVMGETRLSQYQQLQWLRNGWESVIQDWTPDVAVLPYSLPLVTSLEEHNWKRIKTLESRVILLPPPQGAQTPTLSPTL